jgi:hypothetical protein
MSCSWMANALSSLTQEEYVANPFPWGGSIGNVKFVGSDASRVELLQRARPVFEAHEWDSRTPWPADVVAITRSLLKTYYSVAALRLFAASSGVSILGSSGTEEKSVLTERCIEARTPLCSPAYLSAFALHVRAVVAGETPGGMPFVHAPPALAEEVMPPPLPIGEVAPPGPVGELIPPTLDAVNAANAALRQELALANARHALPPMSITPDVLQQLLARIGQAPPSDESKEPTPPGKAKTGWPKVLQDTVSAIKAQELPPILKLARSNRERLQKDSKTELASRRFSLGPGGASLVLPGVDTDTVSVPSGKDTRVWSGLSAFNRLFSIMAGMSEEDFPRASLAELLTVWTEAWDSPMGSHEQKLLAVVAFYDKYVDDLGKGSWVKSFDSDSRFLLEHMRGDNPSPCKHCRGSGEGPSVLGCNGGCGGGSRGGGGSTGLRNTKNSNGTPTKRAGTGASAGVCASMFLQSRTCAGKCGRSHSPCASCGGSCSSAATCGAWDQASVTAKHGDAIAAIARGAKRPRRN